MINYYTHLGPSRDMQSLPDYCTWVLYNDAGQAIGCDKLPTAIIRPNRTAWITACSEHASTWYHMWQGRCGLFKIETGESISIRELEKERNDNTTV